MNKLEILEKVLTARYEYFVYAYVYGDFQKESIIDSKFDSRIAMELAGIMNRYTFWDDVRVVKEKAQKQENPKEFLERKMHFYFEETLIKSLL